jgi:hypothetical protein
MGLFVISNAESSISTLAGVQLRLSNLDPDAEAVIASFRVVHRTAEIVMVERSQPWIMQRHRGHALVLLQEMPLAVANGYRYMVQPSGRGYYGR